MISASVDDLSIQAELEAEDFDASRPSEALKLLMASSMAQLEERLAAQENIAPADGSSAPRAPANAETPKA